MYCPEKSLQKPFERKRKKGREGKEGEGKERRTRKEKKRKKGKKERRKESRLIEASEWNARREIDTTLIHRLKADIRGDRESESD